MMQTPSLGEKVVAKPTTVAALAACLDATSANAKNAKNVQNARSRMIVARQSPIAVADVFSVAIVAAAQMVRPVLMPSQTVPPKKPMPGPDFDC